MKQFAPSELIVTDDGAIYHLNLRPDQIGTTVLLVGDPDRVPKVSKYFDSIEHKVQKREFVTHTGWVGKTYISVISTGIGTDNIDIVINEVDALVNIDFKERAIKDDIKSVDFIRLGTSGGLSAALPPDSLVIGEFGIGFDNLLFYYNYQPTETEIELGKEFAAFAKDLNLSIRPYSCQCNEALVNKLKDDLNSGITLTCPGFYAPQGRKLRGNSILTEDFFEKVQKFSFHGIPVANFEMETSAIYGLSRILGHRAASCNTILANRVSGEFSSDYQKAMDSLIRTVLGKVST